MNSTEMKPKKQPHLDYPYLSTEDIDEETINYKNDNNDSETLSIYH
jgi:hypothetical protein